MKFKDLENRYDFVYVTMKQDVDLDVDVQLLNDWRIEDLIGVEKNGKKGFISRDGKEVCEIIYDNITDCKNGTAYVCLDSKAFMVDKNGIVEEVEMKNEY